MLNIAISSGYFIGTCGAFVLEPIIRSEEKKMILTFFIIFQGLDEWDVFLDDKSRKDVETMLVEGAKKFSKQQFFFISPQNSAYNNPDMRRLNGDKVVIMDLEKSGDVVNNNR